jgi:hypothetical protein
MRVFVRVSTPRVGVVVTARGPRVEAHEGRPERQQRDDDAGLPKNALGDAIDAEQWPRAAWSRAMASNA